MWPTGYPIGGIPEEALPDAVILRVRGDYTEGEKGLSHKIQKVSQKRLSQRKLSQ